MKKALTLTLLMATLFTLAFQQAAFAQSVAVKATVLSRQLTSDLQLNEHGYIRVKALTTEYLSKRKKITDLYAYNPELKKLKLTEAEAGYELRLKLTLRSKELDNYLAIRSQPQGNTFSALPE